MSRKPLVSRLQGWRMKGECCSNFSHLRTDFVSCIFFVLGCVLGHFSLVLLYKCDLFCILYFCPRMCPRTSFIYWGFGQNLIFQTHWVQINRGGCIPPNLNVDSQLFARKGFDAKIWLGKWPSIGYGVVLLNKIAQFN